MKAVHARRLARHGLAEPVAAARLAEQVGTICGAHAQVLSAAELSVGLRVDGATQASVRAALWEERSLVKTFGPRGTVHLLPTRELPLWTAALAAVPSPGGGFAPDVRMSAQQTDAVVAAIADALADAELTVDELTDAVVERAGAWAGDLVMPAFQQLWPRWRQAIPTAAHRGALCFGPDRGRKVTYTNPHRWLPGFAPEPPDAALAELLRRYLHAYGPATPEQFARWLSAPPRWAAELFAARADALEEVVVDGAPAWVVAGDTAFPDEPPRGVRLLPYFDAYAVGCHPRAALFPGRAAERALAGSQAGNFPVLLVDGVVAGVWHLRRSGRRVAITVEPLRRLGPARRRLLEEQVERVGAFFGGRVELTVGPVAVGPHA